MLKKAVKWMYSFPLGVMLDSNRIAMKTAEYVKVIINQSGITELFFGGFLACISAMVSGLNGSIDGSICLASKPVGGADVGATLGGASWTPFALTGIGATGVLTILGSILTGEGILVGGITFNPSLEAADVGLFEAPEIGLFEATEVGLLAGSSLETGLNSLGVPRPFLFKLFVEP